MLNFDQMEAGEITKLVTEHLTGTDKFLVFSAARPGQGGTGHINCLPSKTWAEEFIMRGLTANDIYTTRLALIWSRIFSPLDYFTDNVMVFHK